MGKSSYTLRQELSSLMSARKTWENRISGLKKIKSSIESGLTDEAKLVTDYCNYASTNFGGGLTGVTFNSGITKPLDGYDDLKQKMPQYDADLGCCHSNIVSEISRCERELSSCLESIINKNNEIDRAVAEEEAAARAAQEEAARQAALTQISTARGKVR